MSSAGQQFADNVKTALDLLREIHRIAFDAIEDGDRFRNQQRAENIVSIANQGINVVDRLESVDVARMMKALEMLANITEEDLSQLEQHGKYMQDHSQYGGGVLLKIVECVRMARDSIERPGKQP